MAVIVYKRRLHSLNLFIRPLPHGETSKDESISDASFQLAHWSEGGLEFWAVSETDAQEMTEFRKAFRRASDISH